MPNVIDIINGDIRKRTEATAAVAIVASVVIPVEVVMIILRLFKIGLGALGRIIVVAVSYRLLTCRLKPAEWITWHIERNMYFIYSMKRPVASNFKQKLNVIG